MSNDIHANPVGIISKKDIYIIENDVNSLVYIGQSSNPWKRLDEHYREGSRGETAIGRAIVSIGIEHFTIRILEKNVTNYQERERYWIDIYDSLVPNGYNMTHGGEKPPVRLGDNSPNCLLSDINLNLLKDDLANTNLSLSQLAKKYGISKRQILRINQGVSRCVQGCEYPIRKRPNMNGKLTEIDVSLIIDLLKYSYFFSGEIGNRFGVNEHSVNNINKGYSHKRNGMSYPIRKWKSCGKKSPVTYEQVTEIMQLLKNSNLSLREIASMYGVEHSFIQMINNGNSKRYRRDNIRYPLRKH